MTAPATTRARSVSPSRNGTAADEPPAKRARVTKADNEDFAPPAPPLPRTGEYDEATLAASFADGLLTDATISSLAASFASSGPYLHSVVPALVQPDLLRTVRDEIVTALHFTEKETDIYKVNQTGDLANIDGLPDNERAQLRTIHRLRNALYSATFRDFVSRVTNCGPLSGSKQDMSINSYRQGCHLLNHDDVIGSRRVSYILYVPRPDEEWRPEYGGALELYPCIKSGTPANDPTVVVPPAFNQFIFFTVQPGYSFHSVQEVVVPKDRLSISGWFHIPQRGEEGYNPDGPELAELAGTASLDQLEDDNAQDLEFPFADLTATPETTATDEVETDQDAMALTAADRAYLAEYVNPYYLQDANLAKVNESFVENGSIQITSFLAKPVAATLQRHLVAVDAYDTALAGKLAMAHGTGERDGWTVQGSPVKHRYARLADSNPLALSDVAEGSDLAARTTLHGVRALFASAAFGRLLYQVTGSAPTRARGHVRRFRAGLDYTLATFRSGSEVLDATLALTPSHPVWADGARGGYECYVAPDESNDDPAVYRKAKGGDDDAALLTVPAGWNVLNLVLRDAKVMRFVKYVSALAPSSRWDVAFEYLVAEEEEDREDASAEGDE
ncbi:Oxoglutarate and iron-dependent oxygenase degradation C-term-domain-containing protein [Blastocladiella britannica]|nr:Oxoglutarate and iron-dependent oxygenase degradation C-term-domain-containing protein [Blastocladiella britannica]